MLAAVKDDVRMAGGRADVLMVRRLYMTYESMEALLLRPPKQGGVPQDPPPKTNCPGGIHEDLQEGSSAQLRPAEGKEPFNDDQFPWSDQRRALPLERRVVIVRNGNRLAPEKHVNMGGKQVDLNRLGRIEVDGAATIGRQVVEAAIVTINGHMRGQAAPLQFRRKCRLSRARTSGDQDQRGHALF